MAVMRAGRYRSILFTVFVSVAALDQMSKQWALNTLAEDRVIDIVWTLRLRLVFNTGSAFGRFEGLGPILAVIAFLLVVWLLRSHRFAEERASSVAVGCITGGAVGNLADRLFRSDAGFLAGAVVDFIDVQWWPVWNVADMGIVTGAALLVWCAWKDGGSAGGGSAGGGSI